MEIKELLEVVEYGVKIYRNPETGHKMSLIEYYSLTDLKPRELGKIAARHKKTMLNLWLSEFAEKHVYSTIPVDMESRLRLFHSVKGKELSAEDKLTIKEKLEREGFPLIDGVFDNAARYYVNGGVDSISRENIRNVIIESYNKAHGIEGKTIGVQEQKGAVLVKEKKTV